MGRGAEDLGVGAEKPCRDLGVGAGRKIPLIFRGDNNFMHWKLETVSKESYD